MDDRPLLLAGFEPFGGDEFNPSGTIALALNGTQLPDGRRIHGITLPVSGPAAWAVMSRAIRRVRPLWVVAMGVSGRSELSVESTAWNEDDYRIPDNAGLQPQHSRILPRGPEKLVSAVASMIVAGSFAGSPLPVRVSTDPGRYVCNHLYYRLLHLTSRPGHSARGRSLFLHLPATPEMRRGAGDGRFFYPLADLSGLVVGLLHQASLAGPDDRLG